MEPRPIVTRIASNQPGPTVTIIAGIHGDEPVGVLALNEVLPTLSLKKGTVLGIIANPPALKHKVRFIDQNLNRSLVPGQSSQTTEGRLAAALMPLLDKVDACLDIHAGMGGEPPFVICEPLSFEIAKRLPVSLVSTGWTEAEPGSTDEYLYRQGKPALCIECGDKWDAETMKPLAIETIRQFLASFGMLEWPPLPARKQQLVAVRYPVIKQSQDFRFARAFKGFGPLVPGELIASEEGREYRAPDYPSCIIFPWPEAPIGTEAFLIAEAVREEL